MRHNSLERHSRKIYRLFELLGKTEGQLYIAEIAVLLALLIGTAVYILLLRVLPDTDWLTGCQVRRLTGVICPACGGTRAALALLRGHIGMAIYYHPAMVLLAFMCAAYLIVNTIRLVTAGRTPLMRFHIAYVYVWLVVLILQYILKLVIPGYDV